MGEDELKQRAGIRPGVPSARVLVAKASAEIETYIESLGLKIEDKQPTDERSGYSGLKLTVNGYRITVEITTSISRPAGPRFR